jgi:hypothetical protein
LLGSVKQVGFLDLLEHGIVGSMPGLKNSIRRNKNGQIIVPKIVENIRKTAGTQPLADHEPVFLEYCQFGLIKPKR